MIGYVYQVKFWLKFSTYWVTIFMLVKSLKKVVSILTKITINFFLELKTNIIVKFQSNTTL